MGIPQGTVLGPVLFLVYVNQLLFLNIPNCKILSYADDTMLLFSGKTWDEVYRGAEEGMGLINIWFSMSLLSLNTTKSRFITFSLMKNGQPDISLLTVHRADCNNSNCTCPTIDRVSSIKYLGVFLDQHMRWDAHVEYLRTRLKGLAYIFYNLRDVANTSTLLKVYYSLVESVLKYALVIWGGLYDNALEGLQIIQKYILKIILRVDRTYSTELLFSDCNKMNIRQLYIFECIVHQIKSNSNYVDHSFSTRYRCMESLRVPFVCKSHLQRCLEYLGPKFFNVLPPALKNVDLKKKYNRHKLAEYIGQNYQEFLKVLK